MLRSSQIKEIKVTRHFALIPFKTYGRWIWGFYKKTNIILAFLLFGWFFSFKVPVFTLGAGAFAITEFGPFVDEMKCHEAFDNIIPDVQEIIPFVSVTKCQFRKES